jgi:hypothetical protein
MKTVSLDGLPQNVKCHLMMAIRPIQLWSSVIYRQNVRKVHNEYMDPFHLSLRHDTRRAT